MASSLNIYEVMRQRERRKKWARIKEGRREREGGKERETAGWIKKGSGEGREIRGTE